MTSAVPAGRTSLGLEVRTPAWPGVAAAVAAITAVAAVLITGVALDAVSPPLLVAGYVLGAIGTTVLAAVHRAKRNARRRHPRFRVQRSLDLLASGAMAVGFAAGLANAVLLATELAK